MQKSQQGLLQSLLFQVLDHNPNIIPLVLPIQWAEKYSKPSTPEQQIKTKFGPFESFMEHLRGLLSKNNIQ